MLSGDWRELHVSLFVGQSAEHAHIAILSLSFTSPDLTDI